MNHQPQPPAAVTFAYCQVCLVALFPTDPYRADGYCRICGADRAAPAAPPAGECAERSPTGGR